MITDFYPDATSRCGRNSRCAGLLFLNFFLIIAALYHLKPASRSLFMAAYGADNLPYVWIATALTLVALISLYHRLVARHSRVRVVLGSCALFVTLLLLFFLVLNGHTPLTAAAFYIFVDILSVVLVEQFWSLTNVLFTTPQGKRWYGFIGIGGLLGGVVGGALSAFWLKRVGLDTLDLLLVAALFLVLLGALTLFMERRGLYHESPGRPPATRVAAGGWRTLLANRYLVLIALILLLAQFVEPVVEFQFMKVVEATLEGREVRTAYLGEFYSVLGMVAIGVNLMVTPLLLRWLGVFGGLAAQPLAVSVASLGFMVAPQLSLGAVLKISDRGLSYSINRAAKELLYVPIDPVRIFQAKAWIDMFGYRLFKVLGSLTLLGVTRWADAGVSVAALGWLNLAVCAVWAGVLLLLAREYRALLSRPPVVPVAGEGEAAG